MSFEKHSELDLILERNLDLPVQKIWKGLTDPKILTQWFCPLPWKIKHCEVDLRPGGIFHFVMLSPENQEFPMTGCILEVIENEKLVWTDSLLPGFRPAAEPFFTAEIQLQKTANGLTYRARAIHGTLENRKKHEELGFHDGWSKALDQLIELIRSEKYSS